MTKRVAITGIDGTGKTTLIRKIRERLQFEPTQVQAFRAPQYHEDLDSPFFRLSKAIDDLSVLGDELKDPLLKSTALFLSVSLFGDVERFYESTFKPAHLFSERQPLVDTLSYSVFYKQLLKSPLSEEKHKPLVIDRVGMPAFQAILNWVEVLKSRGWKSSNQISFWNLPLNIYDLVNQDQRKIVEDLKRVYNSRVPDQLVVLKVNSDVLATRLQQKAKSGSAPEELHEKKPVLEMLQTALLSGAQMMKDYYPEMDLQVIDTSHQSIDESLDQILTVSES